MTDFRIQLPDAQDTSPWALLESLSDADLCPRCRSCLPVRIGRITRTEIMPQDYSPTIISPGFLPELGGHREWFARCAAILSILLAVTVLNGMNVMMPRQPKIEAPLRIDLPIVEVKPPPAFELAPEFQLNQTHARPAQASASAVKAVRPSVTTYDAPKTALTLLMPEPPSQVPPSQIPAALAHLSPHSSAVPVAMVNRSASEVTIGTFPGGVKQPRLASSLAMPHIAAPRKLAVPARKVAPISIPGAGGAVPIKNLGKVAPAAIPGVTGAPPPGKYGKVASAGIPGMTRSGTSPKEAPAPTGIELLSKPLP
jgi:hypothetical protein